MENKSFLAILKKNAMLIVLVLVYLFFLILTKGSIFNPSSFTELINQNAYVYILGAGMLMCMLTGGNIDLSCGAFVCLLGALGGLFMVVQGMSTGLSILLLLLIGVAYGVVLGFLIAYVHIPPWIATLAGFLSFRGLGTSILSANSKTGSLSLATKPDFLSIFYGRVLPSEKGVFNVPCFAFGAAAALIVTLLIFTDDNMREHDFRAVSDRVRRVFRSSVFMRRLSQDKANWLKEPVPNVVSGILEFLERCS